MDDCLNKDLIAPCGMNCGICKWYLSYSRGIPIKKGKVTHCAGCLPRNKNCFLKRGCKKLKKNEIKSCFECGDMPCENLDRLDRRYRTRYNMSMVANLNELKTKGMDKFLAAQRKRYRCPKCSGVVCVHDGKCYDCESAEYLARLIKKEKIKNLSAAAVNLDKQAQNPNHWVKLWVF